MDATARPAVIRAGGLLALTLATTLLAACGGASAAAAPDPVAATPAPTASEPEQPQSDSGQSAGGVCALVDPALAGAALGGAALDAGTAKHTSLSGGDGCVFRDTASSDWVSIWVYQDLAREDWDATAEKTGASSGDPVDGLGEAAWLYVGSATGLRLDAFDGGVAVTVQVNQPGVDAGRAAAPSELLVRSLLDQLG